jgi:SAM-dependent methyltransferase
MTAKEHYDTHLGNVYSWMLGNFSEKMTAQRDWFLKSNVQPSLNGLAVDLGAGHGLQSVALAKIGFKVIAVDFNKQLLEELSTNKEDLPVSMRHEDILDFLDSTTERPELIVCMGDTLTHLRNYQDVEKVIHDISRLCIEGGKVIFSFRDLSVERKGVDRFVHIRSDDQRSMTCFLEYFQDYVMVYDLINEKTEIGWVQNVSNYPKLRIGISAFKNTLQQNGINVIAEEVMNGMYFLTGVRVNPR